MWVYGCKYEYVCGYIVSVDTQCVWVGVGVGV